MEYTMLIRKANINDAESIANHNILLAKESEGLEISKEEVLNGVKGILDDLGKGFYIVAEHDKKIIGELMITYEWSDWRGKNMWWIQSAYVKEDWRKKGVFRNLVEEIQILAKDNGIDIIRLYVHNHNKKAIKVYEKLGMTGNYTVFEYE